MDEFDPLGALLASMPVPEEVRPARKKRQQPEYKLQVAVADRIRRTILPNVFFTALPFGEKRSAATGARLKRAGVLPGCPDLFFIVAGKCIGMELKTEKDALRGISKGYLSPEQRAVQQAWEAAGGKYILANGYDSAIAALEIHQVIRPDVSLQRPQPQTGDA